MHDSASIFSEGLIVENILCFSNVFDWIKNKPPLINQVFCNVFKSEYFAKRYLIHILNLNDEQVRLLEEKLAKINLDEENEEEKQQIDYENLDQIMIGQTNTIPNYSSMQDVFKEYISCSLLPKINLTKLFTQYSIESDESIANPMIHRIEDECKVLILNSKMFEESLTEYYDCDLIISENKSDYKIKNVSRFWKGGPLKQCFIKSIKSISVCFDQEEGGFDIEMVLFMGFGYPLNIRFRGDYHFVPQDFSILKEEVFYGEKRLFYAEYDHHLSTCKSTYSIMNNFLSVKQDDIPKELSVIKVYNTLLYHWFGPFFYGKSQLKYVFPEELEEANFFSSAIYLSSHMKPTGQKRKAEESITQTKKTKI